VQAQSPQAESPFFGRLVYQLFQALPAPSQVKQQVRPLGQSSSILVAYYTLIGFNSPKESHTVDGIPLYSGRLKSYLSQEIKK
jgi:hypothetical protein